MLTPQRHNRLSVPWLHQAAQGVNGRPSCRHREATANRRLVGTGIAAVSEEGGGILSGDAVERGSKRLSKSLDGARSDPPQIGLHLSPARFDRAEVRAVAGQIAIGKA